VAAADVGITWNRYAEDISHGVTGARSSPGHAGRSMMRACQLQTGVTMAVLRELVVATLVDTTYADLAVVLVLLHRRHLTSG
jgi:hypothetical protein